MTRATRLHRRLNVLAPWGTWTQHLPGDRVSRATGCMGDQAAWATRRRGRLGGVAVWATGRKSVRATWRLSRQATRWMHDEWTPDALGDRFGKRPGVRVAAGASSTGTHAPVDSGPGNCPDRCPRIDGTDLFGFRRLTMVP